MSANRPLHLIPTLGIVVFLSPGFAQDSGFQMNSRYFNLGLELESSAGLKGGFSLGYMLKPDMEGKYYLGLEVKAFSSHGSRSITAYYHGFETRKGALESQLSIASLSLIQRYFLYPGKKETPFIGIDLGTRFADSEVDTEFMYYSGFPFGWLPNGDMITESSSGSFFGNVQGGYWINLLNNRGLYIIFGIDFSKPIKIIDENSVFYNANGIHYTTNQSSPVFVNIGFGFLI